MSRRPVLLTVLGIGIWGYPPLAEAEPDPTALAKFESTASTSSFAPGEHPGALPWGTSYVGVSWVNGHDAIAPPLVESSGYLRASRWQVGFVLGHAPWSLHSHTRIENGYRLWGALAQRAVSEWGASHATLSMSFDNVRYSDTATGTTSLELRLSSRLDLKLLAPSLRSFFVDGDLGYAGRRSIQTNGSAVRDLQLAQYGVGLGFYLGDPTTHGTEIKMRFARDFKSYCEEPALVPEQLARPEGCAGFEVWHFLSPTWGVRGQYEVGHHGWVLGLHVVGRAWSESAESNGLFDFGQ